MCELFVRYKNGKGYIGTRQNGKVQKLIDLENDKQHRNALKNLPKMQKLADKWGLQE